MQSKPLRPADIKILREGLIASQQELFEGWRLYTEKWIEDHYKSGGILDFQSAMSEALLALRRAVVNHNGRSRFRPYLDRCLKNAMEDMRLRERRRRQTSIDALPTPRGGTDRDGIEALVEDRLPSREDSRIVRMRPRKQRRRYCRLSSVLISVIRKEAADAYQRGLADGWRSAWRGALRACGKSKDDIEKLIAEEEARLRKEAAKAASAERRAKRAAQQRARRQRQRQQTVPS